MPRSGFPVLLLVPLLVLGSVVSSAGQLHILPLGDSITNGPQGGAYSDTYERGGYRYFLERFLEASHGGPTGFTFTGTAVKPHGVGSSAGTIASYWGQWYPNAKPLNHPLHAGYSGYTIEQIDALVADGTIPVADSDLILLQIGTNNIGVGNTTPATQAEITAWTAAYQSLLDHILAMNPAATVVMAKIPPVTNGSASNTGANSARIGPFNQQVVGTVCHAYQAAHPGQFLLIDNHAPLDPLNWSNSYATATNNHDFFTGIGDGVHPYNAGHRKIAANFWKASQLAGGAASADLVTTHDGDGGADACLLGNGGSRSGTGGDQLPFVLASNTQGSRAKFYLKLDLAGKPKNWDQARLNLIFWGAPSSWPGWGNCCNDAPSATTMQLFGIADGGDGWTEQSITWANAPGNDTAGNSVTGTFLGDLVIPAGTRTGDIISVESAALRDFVNLQRGADGLLTFAIVGATADPGFYPSFQDAEFRDYCGSFLQLSMNAGSSPAAATHVVSSGFELANQLQPRAALTFRSSATQRYLVSASSDLRTFDEVLAEAIPGAPGATETTVTIDLPAPPRPRLFLRVEVQSAAAAPPSK